MRIRARFAETDQMGIIHHAAYVPWLEAGRIEWLRERGLLYRDLEADGVSLAVASVEVAYRLAARFDDLIEVRTRLTEVRSRRLVFEYELWREEGEPIGLIATGRTSHVPTDSGGRAVRLPPVWLEAVTALLHDPSTSVTPGTH